MNRAAALAALLALAGCSLQPPHPEAFAFGVMGDAPYDVREEMQFEAMLAAAGGEPLAFLVHVGDFKAGSGSRCTDALFEQRRRMLDASAHPLVLTPGDNDWADCRRRSNGAMDPLERLARLRSLFYSDAFSLGRARMPLDVQDGCAEPGAAGCRCPGLPENRMWIHRGVVFATIHVVGSNDNVGFDAASDADARCRQAANRRWLERAFALAAGGSRRGLVVFAQANPWVSSERKVYDALLAQLAEGAKRLSRPALFVHGDTHGYRVDRPFRDAKGERVGNLTRLETMGSPLVGWVRVTVDPGDADLYRFEPRE